jgi:hypothetical protein
MTIKELTKTIRKEVKFSIKKKKEAINANEWNYWLGKSVALIETLNLIENL